MEILKIAMIFVSLACLTFGKFIEPKARDASESFEETLERAETLQDTTLSQSEDRVNDYFSRFLAAPAADNPRYRNMCGKETTRTRSSELFGDSDKEYHPALVFQTSCTSTSDGEPMRCGINYCVTQTQRMEFNMRPKGSDGRWRKKLKTIDVGCSCMSRH